MATIMGGAGDAWYHGAMRFVAVLLCVSALAAPSVAETSAPRPALTLDIRTIAELQTDEGIEFSARDVLDTLARSFPRRVEDVRLIDGEWTLKVSGERFYWAGGRLLPGDAREKESAYDPYPFYSYHEGPVQVPTYTEQARRRLDELVAFRDRNPVRRHPGFMNALWRIEDQESAWRRQKTTYFLGMKTMIHRELLEDLAAVEEEIQRRMLEDGELARFVDSLVRIEGYNYRRVDQTATLSNHAFGIALDFLPRSYGGRQVYWRWAYDAGLAWHSIPAEQRFSVPDSFVEAFERYGFVWGGKWRFYDVIHFEYRPEILMLNGIDVRLR